MKGYTVLDRELYLPKECVEDKKRSREAGIPEDIEFWTKPKMALDIIKSAHVPFTWVTGDCVYEDYRAPDGVHTFKVRKNCRSKS